jgi:hypothetical protein
MADVTGLSNVLNNLNREIINITNHTKEGLDSAAQHIMLEAMSRAPDDTTNLKDSSFHNPYTSSNGFGETVGFREEYAAAVHEMDKKTDGTVPRTRAGSVGHFWDQGGPKFLEMAIFENIGLIFNIIRRFASRG